MLSSEKMRRVRERRKQAELCPQCGETRPEANRAACRPCLDYNAMIQGVIMPETWVPRCPQCGDSKVILGPEIKMPTSGTRN